MRAAILLLMLLAYVARPAFGAFTFLTSASGSASFSTGAVATLNTTGANLIVVVVSYSNASTGLAVADSVHSNPGCYVLAKNQSGTSLSTVATFYCVNPSSVGIGHVISDSGTNIFSTIFVAAYSGSKVTSPVDLTSGAAVTGTSIQPGSLTPTCTNELLVTGVAVSGTGVVSGVSGATLRQNVPGLTGNWLGGGLADSIQTTAVAFNPTWSISSASEALAANSVSFIAADSNCGGTSPVKHHTNQ